MEANALATLSDPKGIAYRDAREVLLARHATAAVALQARAVTASMRSVYARRFARMFAGAVGVFGAFGVAALAAVLAWHSHEYGGLWGLPSEREAWLARALVLAASAALLAWVPGLLLGRLLARRSLGRAAALLAQPPVDADPLAHAEELSAPGALRAVLARAGVGEAVSVALPLAALSLLAPLSIHRIVVTSLNGASGFGGWISVSLLIVGHCHLLLAYLGVRHAQALARSACPVPSGAASGWRALGLTTLASLVPGVVLMAVPVVLVAVTGALFVPAAWAWAAASVRREREASRASWCAAQG